MIIEEKMALLRLAIRRWAEALIAEEKDPANDFSEEIAEAYIIREAAACDLALAVLDEALLPLCYGTAIESRKECGERLRRCGARRRAEIAALAQHEAAS